MSILQQKRNLSNIDPNQLTIEVFDGKKRLDNFLSLASKLSSAVNITPEIYEYSRDELFHYVIQSSNDILDAVDSEVNDEKRELPPEANLILNFSTTGAIGKYVGGYLIQVMGTKEQNDAWMPSINNGVWYLTYAQTELGHGTDVQGLETLATFDTKTQEFIIHSPSISAIKFWPGDLSVAATHAVVMARLISNGKFHGVKPFVFRIRDQKTMMPLPGVEIGDIGPKLGMSSKDNGYMR